jgi:hypothetical protein
MVLPEIVINASTVKDQKGNVLEHVTIVPVHEESNEMGFVTFKINFKALYMLVW